MCSPSVARSPFSKLPERCGVWIWRQREAEPSSGPSQTETSETLVSSWAGRLHTESTGMNTNNWDRRRNGRLTNKHTVQSTTTCCPEFEVKYSLILSRMLGTAILWNEMTTEWILCHKPEESPALYPDFPLFQQLLLHRVSQSLPGAAQRA